MKLTKSHPVARAMRAGKSMKAAWAAYKHGRNPARRRNGHRRRHHRNPLLATLSNPLPNIGALVRKVPVIGPRIAGAVSTDNVKKGVAVGITIGGAMLLPTVIANKGWIGAERLTGLQGIGITVLAGVAVAAGVSMAIPSAAPVALASAVGAGVLQAILTYGRSYLGLGQVPAGLINGGVGDFLTLARGGGMGAFMTVKKPFQALPSGQGLGSGQRFSKVY